MNWNLLDGASESNTEQFLYDLVLPAALPVDILRAI